MNTNQQRGRNIHRCNRWQWLFCATVSTLILLPPSFVFAQAAGGAGGAVGPAAAPTTPGAVGVPTPQPGGPNTPTPVPNVTAGTRIPATVSVAAIAYPSVQSVPWHDAVGKPERSLAGESKRGPHRAHVLSKLSLHSELSVPAQYGQRPERI